MFLRVTLKIKLQDFKKKLKPLKFNLKVHQQRKRRTRRSHLRSSAVRRESTRAEEPNRSASTRVVPVAFGSNRLVSESSPRSHGRVRQPAIVTETERERKT